MQYQHHTSPLVQFLTGPPAIQPPVDMLWKAAKEGLRARGSSWLLLKLVPVKSIYAFVYNKAIKSQTLSLSLSLTHTHTHTLEPAQSQNEWGPDITTPSWNWKLLAGKAKHTKTTLHSPAWVEPTKDDLTETGNRRVRTGGCDMFPNGKEEEAEKTHGVVPQSVMTSYTYQIASVPITGKPSWWKDRCQVRLVWSLCSTTLYSKLYRITGH